MKSFAKVCCATLALVTSLSTFTSYGADTKWRSVDLDNTVLMTLPHGKAVIELAPEFAPKHVAQFKKLVAEGFYTDNKFYRVIDGFVAQAGPPQSVVTRDQLGMEGEIDTDKNWSFTKVQDNDLFAQQTGFKKGFAVAHNPSEKAAWLTHCPGVIAMARGNRPSSASSHFYFTIGQAPRYLDRIMSIFGRVVYGMENIQSIQRTQVVEGDKRVYPDQHTPIVAMQLMSDVPEKDRILIEVEATQGKAFNERMEKRRKRDSAFFYKKPPPILDVCQVPIKSRMVKK
jgi:peptidylprolyl isomerase